MIAQLNTTTQNFNLKEILLKQIFAKGGWVNAHAHIDRAFTICEDSFKLTGAHLHEKWQLVDHIKSTSTTTQIYDRMSRSIEQMIKQNVTGLGTFIDCDSVIKDKALKAAWKVRAQYKSDIKIKFISHTSKGVTNKEQQKWQQEAWDFVDIIGGLPAIDKDQEEEHLDILFSEAQRSGKILHIHVDQLNQSNEKETEQLIRKTKEYGLEGRVVAVHGVSIAAQKAGYRKRLYKKMAQAGVMLVCCPTAWIDSRRSEVLSVSHNSIAPVEELIPAGVVVGMGTDNIADIYKPFSDGDMWTELRVLLESCHYYDIEQLVNIATINGRKTLGLL